MHSLVSIACSPGSINLSNTTFILANSLDKTSSGISFEADSLLGCYLEDD
jgi:hypothetical protein